MNPMNGIQALPDALRSIDSATFTGAYQAVGVPLTRRIRLVKFLNNSSVPVTVSWDGVTDHDYIPANSFALYDVTTNELFSQGWFVANKTQFYVKGAAGVRLFYIFCLG